MDSIVSALLDWFTKHLSLVAMGLMGATLNAILSEDRIKDRLIGFCAGFILCIALAEPVANLLAGGKSIEVFGFLLGAIGKSTAELLLNWMRGMLVKKLGEIEK